MDAALAQGQMELTQLQQELAEDAPLLPESQLLAVLEEKEYVPSPPGTVTAPVLEMLAQSSQPKPSQRGNLTRSVDDVHAAAAAVEVSNKRAKNIPTETVPTTTTTSEMTQREHVATGRKATKKKRKA